MSDKWKIPQLQKLRQFFISGAEPRRAEGRERPVSSGNRLGHDSAEMPTAPNPSRKCLRHILDWMLAPPLWKSECQSAIDAYAEDNRRVIAQMDEDIAAFKAAEAPRVERGNDAWLK